MELSGICRATPLAPLPPILNVITTKKNTRILRSENSLLHELELSSTIKTRMVMVLGLYFVGSQFESRKIPILSLLRQSRCQSERLLMTSLHPLEDSHQETPDRLRRILHSQCAVWSPD